MKLSILNLAPVREGQTYLQAVESMVSLAKHAENIGIERYWIAEHHNMKNLVSSATALLIQHTLALSLIHISNESESGNGYFSAETRQTFTQKY